MVRKPERAERVVNRGAWTAEEDQKLVDYVRTHGDKKWRTLPAKAGLNRCGKSCRLRWLNYLRPGIKRGNISEDEEDLIIRLHNLLGNRWSLIAGRLPGRTDNEIKNHWNTHLSKKSLTITDLNSKLNQKLERSNHSHSHSHGSHSQASISVLPSSGDAHQQVFDMDDLLSLPLPPEFDDIVSLDYPCQSFPKTWYPHMTAEESFGFFDDLAAFLDYKDYLFYFP